MPHTTRLLSCSLSGTSARGASTTTPTIASSRRQRRLQLKPPTTHVPTRRRSSVVLARGGSNFGGGMGDGRLIIPGQTQQGGRGGGGGGGGGRLIIPGQERGGGARPGRGGGGGGPSPGRGGGGAGGSVFGNNAGPPPPPEGASPIGVTLDAPSKGNFRPPPGFMEAGAEASWILGASGGGPSTGEPFDVDIALSGIRATAGPWHQLAGLLPQLNAAGIDAMAVEVETGIERATQALWQTAAQVYLSLKNDGEFPAKALAAFDSAPGAPALHEFRNLPADMRRSAAEYLATGGEMAASGSVLDAVDVDLASTLARAYREWERRAREREGFSQEPGDVLAFKHWRDAAECRKEEDKDKAIERGLKVAVSGSAREKLEALSSEAIARVVPAAEAAAAAAAAGLLSPDAAAASSGAKLLPLTISRLQPAETLFVPVPLLPSALGKATPAELASLPTARPTGPFGAFGGDASKFVVLPLWTTVQGLSGLAAVPVKDCSSVPEVLAAAVVSSGVVGAKKIDEVKEELRGPGLLVVDRDGGSKARARSDASGGQSGVGVAVLAAGDNGALAVRDVAGVDGADPSSVATVLFVVRPPKVSVITESDSNTASFEM